MTREEAIEVYNGLLNQKIKEAFEFFVPELRESEDERIIKTLQEYVKNRNWRLNGPTQAEVLDWLEKQKEQKPVEIDEDVELGLDRALQIVEKAKGNLQGYQTDDGIYECDHAIGTLKHILKRGIKQKPAEISPNQFDGITYGMQGHSTEQNPVGSIRYYDSMDELIADALIDEIENSDLPGAAKHNRVTWINKHRTQSAEWSEEDERIRKELIEFLDGVWHLGKNANFDKWGKADCAKWIAWVKKQKEQKPIPPNIEREYIEKRLKGLIDKEGEYYRGAREELAHLFYILGGQPSQYLTNNVAKEVWSDEDIEKNLIAYLRYERKSTPQEIEEKFIPYIKRIKIMEQESVSPMSYGSLDEAMQEAGRRFDLPCTDKDKYSVADVFYAGVRAERESKQEWSTEDEKIAKEIEEELWYPGDFPDYPSKEESELYDDCQRRLDWFKNKLKSFRLQKLDASKLENFDPVDVLNRIKTEWPMAWEKVVGKQEWSEENKMDIELLIALLRGKVNLIEILDSRKESIINFLKSLPQRFSLQPKQEWSDRDEEILEFVLGLLDNLVWRRDWEISQAECLEWLVKVLNSTNKKWSEEDENVIETLIRALRFNAQFDFEVRKLGLDYVQTLTVLDKCRRLYPKPHWKPSEE